MQSQQFHFGSANSSFVKTENVSVWLEFICSLVVFVNAIDEIVRIPIQINRQVIENEAHSICRVCVENKWFTLSKDRHIFIYGNCICS